MSLISLIYALIFIGVALYLISMLPIDDTIKQIIRVVIILFVLLWVLQFFLGGSLPGLRLH